jgi:hypothetical protein
LRDVVHADSIPRASAIGRSGERRIFGLDTIYERDTLVASRTSVDRLMVALRSPRQQAHGIAARQGAPGVGGRALFGGAERRVEKELDQRVRPSERNVDETGVRCAVHEHEGASEIELSPQRLVARVAQIRPVVEQ